MAVEVKKIQHNSRELGKFVQFGIDLYRGNDKFVPPLVMDDVATLIPSKNPAYDYCEAQAFMAYRDGKPVGRIVAIINKLVNQRDDAKRARFGFVDFIDDNEVVDALFAAAEGWAKERGMNEMVGPMGFTDMDHEGMLIEGFDEMGTMATIYNYAYYPTHLERLGYVKDVDWVEYRIKIPAEVPDRIKRFSQLVQNKYQLRSVKFTSRKKLAEKYGHALFDLINEAYDSLYGYSPLSERQIDHYIDIYLSVLRLDCIAVIVDKDDNLVALGISMPSMSKALQRSRGKFLPFGWVHLLQGIYGKNDVVDLMLIAVKKEYMKSGASAMIFDDLIQAFNRQGYKEAESNIELEGNDSVRLLWQYFDHRLHRRRRAFKRSI